MPSLVGSEMCIRDRPDLQPQTINFENKDLIARDQSVRRDFHTQQLPPLHVGQEVVLQHHLTNRWDTEAVITHVRDNGASYFVKTRQGRELLRGRRLIRPAPTATRAPVLNQARRLQTFIMSSSSSSSHVRSSSASGGARDVSRRDRDPSWRPVSYTHLTLPTIYSV